MSAGGPSRRRAVQPNQVHKFVPKLLLLISTYSDLMVSQKMEQKYEFMKTSFHCFRFVLKLGLFGTLKLALVLQFIVTNAYFSVARTLTLVLHATLK